MYKTMKGLEKYSQGTEFMYWIEGFLISRLRALKLLELMDEEHDSYDEVVEKLRKTP
jgi:hypothetical protein